MTEKELLYFEDAVGHEKSILKIINESKNYIDDERLISFFDNQEETHKQVLDGLIDYLKEKANE